MRSRCNSAASIRWCALVYRFGLAAALLYIWCVLRGKTIRLSREQHLAAIGVGFYTFAIDYAFTYWAEERVVSAVVAVIFGALAFVNLITFRLVLKERAPRAAWATAALGAAGVAVLSWSEIAQSDMNTRTLIGLAMVIAAVVAATFGNIFARRGEEAGAPLAASTAWSMTYGSILLAIYATATGRAWSFELSATYVLSLFYLAVVGSVIAFLLYCGLARRRGFTVASYILALTPLLAMVISTVFEGKRWSLMGLGGVALVLVGQWLLLRTKSAGERRDQPVPDLSY